MNSGSTGHRRLSLLSFPGRFVVQDYLIRPGSALLSPAGYNVPLPCDPRFEGLGGRVQEREAWACCTSLRFLMWQTKFGGRMKRLAWILAFPLWISVLGKAQSAPPASSSEGAEGQQRMFFPRDMFW